MDTETHAPVVRSFRAHPSALYEVRQFIRALAGTAGLPRDLTADLVLAVTEACANSILHTTTPEVTVSWRTAGGCVEVEVRDGGVFRRRVPMPEVDGPGGHGIPLMMALVDEFVLQEGSERRPGTLVRLVKCREG
jgi:anti-sigma regulatory factor (Ser/Thr protein kinase)